jgi:hypothetical protein
MLFKFASYFSPFMTLIQWEEIIKELFLCKDCTLIIILSYHKVIFHFSTENCLLHRYPNSQGHGGIAFERFKFSHKVTWIVSRENFLRAEHPWCGCLTRMSENAISPCPSQTEPWSIGNFRFQQTQWQ